MEGFHTSWQRLPARVEAKFITVGRGHRVAGLNNGNTKMGSGGTCRLAEFVLGLQLPQSCRVTFG